MIAKYSITGGEQNTVYNCSFNMSVNKPSDIQSGDMTLKLTGLGAKINGLPSVSIDLAEADSTYQVKFSRVGNGIGNLVVGDITFNNTDVEQNYLESKTLNTSVTLSGMECSIETTEEPDLFEGTLTPVVYDGNNWKIVEATDKNWYDYENQEWANAVILRGGLDKGVGDTVSVEGDDPDVLAMYVWIPRYEYRIEGKYGLGGTSASSPGEIEVNFISKDTTIASDGYMIHPAFTFGGEELPGIWVAKFEISHTELSPSATANNLECYPDTCGSVLPKTRILPNVQSLRRNSIYWFYRAINDIAEDSEVVDSHIMKNSEWGAVAYLTQSTYGKYGNDDYSGADKEVYINNSSSYYTGRSGGTYSGNVSAIEYGTYTYDGYLLNGNIKTNERNLNAVASTTGNITGIYDMSGGAAEYVMGVFANEKGEVWSGANSTNNSLFDGKLGTNGTNYYDGAIFPDEKYYDMYKGFQSASGLKNYTKSSCGGGTCYGHALDETKSWYGDTFSKVLPTLPWLERGGASTSKNAIAGIYHAYPYNGSSFAQISTRPVLVSKKVNAINKYKEYENGEVVYFDVEKGMRCTNYNEENSKTGYNGIDNKSGNQNSCLKFYAFNDNGEDTVKLLLDHNTTATTLWNSTGNSGDGPIDTLNQLKIDTKDWKGTIEPLNYTTGIDGLKYTINYDGYNARLLTANEISKLTGNFGWNENVASDYMNFFFDTNTDNQEGVCSKADNSECNFGWIYDRTSIDCEEEGCPYNADVDISGYWTASPNGKKSISDTHTICDYNVVFGVSHHGRLGHTCPQYEGHYGVRPVIEVSKKDLESTYDSICALAYDSTVAAGQYGAKYNCKVDPNKETYTFYFVGNNSDGTSNLIMSHNINVAGEAVIPNESSDLGIVAWYEDEQNNINGPVTAMTYLYKATKSWTNLEPLNYSYYDRQIQGISRTDVGYNSFVSVDGIATITKGDSVGTKIIIGTSNEPLRTRMPVYTKNSTYLHLNEIHATSSNQFLYNNLSFSLPEGYWTMSSFSYSSSANYKDYSYRVQVGQPMSSDYDSLIYLYNWRVNDNIENGVRPVITVKL